MSAFSDWKATVYFQKTPIDEHLEQAFNAGMERAAENVVV